MVTSASSLREIGATVSILNVNDIFESNLFYPLKSSFLTTSRREYWKHQCNVRSCAAGHPAFARCRNSQGTHCSPVEAVIDTVRLFILFFVVDVSKFAEHCPPRTSRKGRSTSRHSTPPRHGEVARVARLGRSWSDFDLDQKGAGTAPSRKAVPGRAVRLLRSTAAPRLTQPRARVATGRLVLSSSFSVIYSCRNYLPSSACEQRAKIRIAP